MGVVMTVDLDKLERVVNLAIKFEVHALVMLVVGAVLALHGQHDMAQLVVGGALAVFRGGQK